MYIESSFLPLTSVDNLITFKWGNITETCSCPFAVKSCCVRSWAAKLPSLPPLAAPGTEEVGPPCPPPARGRPGETAQERLGSSSCYIGRC